MKKKIDLEFILQSFKKLVDKYNFEVSIPVTILKDGTLVIDQIDVKIKKFLSLPDTMDKIGDLKNLADEIVDNTRGTFRLILQSETPEYDLDGYQHYPKKLIYYPIIYSGIEIDRIEISKEDMDSIKTFDGKNGNFILYYIFFISPDNNIAVMRAPHCENYEKIEKINNFTKYKKRIEEFLLKNFENLNKYTM